VTFDLLLLAKGRLSQSAPICPSLSQTVHSNGQKFTLTWHTVAAKILGVDNERIVS